MKIVSNIPSNAIEVFRLLPEGTRAEVLNNILYMSPSPFYQHQKISAFLIVKIGQFVLENESGEFFHAPFDVYLEEQQSAVQPDIFFISNANRKIIKGDGYIHGAPDLIIEILSSDENRDRKLKKEIYEKAGVKEYFIVEPKTKMTEAYLLKNKKYVHQYSRKKYFSSSLLKLEFTF